MQKLSPAGALILFVAIASSAQSQDVVRAHLQAVGGKDVVQKIKTIQHSGSVSGSSSYGPLNGTFDEAFDLATNSGFSEFKLTGYTRDLGWSGEQGWAKDSINGEADLQASDREFAELLSAPSALVAVLLKHGSEILHVNGPGKFNGKACVTISVNTSPMEFYVRSEDHLLEGLSVPGQTSVTFDDYRSVDGVQFAGKRVVKIESQGLTIVYSCKSTKVNEPIDQRKTTRPSVRSKESKAAVTPQQSSSDTSAEALIAAVDKNGDGRVSKEEAPAELKSTFEYIDANHDGQIDVKEAEVIVSYMKGQSQSPAGKPQPQPSLQAGNVTAEQLVKQMDRDGDAGISRAEADADLKLFFADLDANGDGLIDVQEAAPAAAFASGNEAIDPKQAASPETYTTKQIVSFLDSDGDGKISKTEANADLKPYFDYGDTDRDGLIDEKEMAALMKAGEQQQKK